MCAAVLAVDISELATEHLGIKLDDIKFYSDSKVVLRYIYNQTRKFFIYVSNRVERIRKSTEPSQWNYVPTEHNPADVGTRTLSADNLKESTWLIGPVHSLKKNHEEKSPYCDYHLVEVETDKDIRKTDITTCVSTVSQAQSQLFSGRMQIFSCWERLVNSFALLKGMIRKRRNPISYETATFQEAELFIIQKAQHEQFSKEIQCIQQGLHIPKNSRIAPLGPVLDSQSMLRVGG
jgi:hypothetical protein